MDHQIIINKLICTTNIVYMIIHAFIGINTCYEAKSLSGEKRDTISKGGPMAEEILIANKRKHRKVTSIKDGSFYFTYPTSLQTKPGSPESG